MNVFHPQYDNLFMNGLDRMPPGWGGRAQPAGPNWLRAVYPEQQQGSAAGTAFKQINAGAGRVQPVTAGLRVHQCSRHGLFTSTSHAYLQALKDAYRMNSKRTRQAAAAKAATMIGALPNPSSTAAKPDSAEHSSWPALMFCVH